MGSKKVGLKFHSWLRLQRAAGTFKGTENRWMLLEDQEATDRGEAALVAFESTFSKTGKYPVEQYIYIL